MNMTYLCIDLKSFYASVECVDRGLDPLTNNLVVVDLSRTEKTICLEATQLLKAYGASGRTRLFEVIRKVEEVNRLRKSKAPGRKPERDSSNDIELKGNPVIASDYIVATSRMEHYIEVSALIYGVYLKYIVPEDIHVYSIYDIESEIYNGKY